MDMPCFAPQIFHELSRHKNYDPDPRSEPTLRKVAMPADTNPSGDIFGGWVMAQMDLAGGMAGTERAAGRMVTVVVDGTQVI
jgi:acyl-CoA thioesterase YciA